MLLSNLRDVGGMSAGGGRIAPGTLFRAAAPQRQDPALANWLHQQGISSIFDLRSDQERSYMPGFSPGLDGVQLVQMPLLDGALGRLRVLEQIYEPLVRNHGPVWARLAAGIAESRASLVHCTAGKDRTGVGVALVLLAVGAEKDAVMADYSASTEQLSGAWIQAVGAQMAQHGVPLTDELRTLMVGTSVAALDRALDVARGYGSIADYLITHGLTAAQLETLGDKLVVS